MNKYIPKLEKNFNKTTKILKDHIYPILFFALLNLRIITWFQPGHVVFSGDFRPFLTWEAFINKINGVWTEVDFGTPSFYFTRKYSIFELFSMIAYRIFGDLTISQIIATYVLYMIFSIVGYFLYYLLTQNKLISFVSAFFLTTNPLLINDREITALGFVNYYFVPTIIILLLYVYSLEKSNLFYAFSAGLLVFLATSAFPNPKTLIFVITLVIYITLFLLFKKKYIIINVKKNSNKTINISFVLDSLSIKRVLIHLFLFVVGFLIDLVPILHLYMSEQKLILRTLKWYQNTSPTFIRKINPIEFLRFIFRWSFFSGAFGRPYVPYRDLYVDNLFFKLLMYVPFVVILITVIYSLKYRKYRLYTVFSFIPYALSILTSYSIVCNDLTFMVFSKSAILRSLIEPVYLSFYTVLFAALIFGICLQILNEIIRKIFNDIHKQNILSASLLFMFLILFSAISYPLFSGDITRNWLDPNVKGYYLPIEIYKDINRKISNDYWVLLLPHRYTYVYYNETNELWGSGNPYPKIFGFPYISGLGTEYIRSSSDDVVEYIYSLFHDNHYGSQDIIKLFGLLGIRYVLIEKNIIFGARDSYDIYLNKLLSSSNVEILSNYSNRVLLSLNISNKIIYIAKKYSFYQNYTDLVEDVKNIKYINDLKGYVFIDKSYKYIYDLLDRYPNIIGEGKLINVNKYSPSHIMVEVSSDKYFILVLQESYDDNWVVYINGKKLDPRLHFKVNGYGNGWLIPVKGFAKIDIVYLPSRIDIIYTFYPFLFIIAMIVYYVLNKGFHNPRFNFRKRV